MPYAFSGRELGNDRVGVKRRPDLADQIDDRALGAGRIAFYVGDCQRHAVG